MKIGQSQIEQAYEVARKVHRSLLTVEAGAQHLESNAGMNRGSARDYIRALQCILSGERFTRTVNAQAADYFLEKIAADFGPEKLALGIQSLNSHIIYYESTADSNLQKLRAVVNRHAMRAPALDQKLTLDLDFLNLVERSLADSSSARSARLQIASRFPKKAIVTTQVFIRNPDVVAEALFRAGGHCESCRERAPFERKTNGQPYLEVHHKVHLSQGGEDTLENAIALCPNCHRRLHFGLIG